MTGAPPRGQPLVCPAQTKLRATFAVVKYFVKIETPIQATLRTGNGRQRTWCCSDASTITLIAAAVQRVGAASKDAPERFQQVFQAH